MYRIILLFIFSVSLFAQEPELIIKDHQDQTQPNQSTESPIELHDIEEKNHQDRMEEKTQKEEMQDDNPQDYFIKEQQEAQEQEIEVQEEIKKREKIEKEKEALEAERARVRNMQAEEAKRKEEQERKIKEEKQKTNLPAQSKSNAPAIQTPNPNANPASPDFFDLNKSQSYEKLRSIGPKELREKIEQCEEKEDKNACFDIGMIYYQGRSVYGQQLKHAFYFFDRSCDEKKGLGCYEAGIIGANFKQYPYALIFLEKSCQSKDLRGCKNLGILYYNGWGAPKNVNRAIELFNFGCKSGDQSSCQKFYLALGNAYKESRNFIGAKKNYQKGCELGDEQSCKEMEIVDLVQKELYRQNVIENNAKRRP